MIKEVALIDAEIKAREAASESRPLVKVIAGSQHLAPRFDKRVLKKHGKAEKLSILSRADIIYLR
jgi:hypothetical protein